MHTGSSFFSYLNVGFSTLQVTFIYPCIKCTWYLTLSTPLTNFDGGRIPYVYFKIDPSEASNSGVPFSTLVPQAAHTALAQDCCLVALELPAERPSPRPVIAESGAPCFHLHCFSLGPHLFSLSPHLIAGQGIAVVNQTKKDSSLLSLVYQIFPSTLIPHQNRDI